MTHVRAISWLVLWGLVGMALGTGATVWQFSRYPFPVFLATMEDPVAGVSEHRWYCYCNPWFATPPIPFSRTDTRTP